MNENATREPPLKTGASTYSSEIANARNYMNWVLSVFRPYLRGNIVEVGIGHGSYCRELSRLGYYLGVDLDEKSIEDAKTRFPGVRFVQADILQNGFLRPWLNDPADAIVSVNVLEHIDNDRRALSNLVDALKIGGFLLVSVPALMLLYNDLDKLAGHCRRYNLSDFRDLLAGQPVAIERLCYFNPLGGLGWLANRAKTHQSLDSGAVNGQIKLFDKYGVPLSRLLDPLFRSFFGQSVTCIARRT